MRFLSDVICRLGLPSAALVLLGSACGDGGRYRNASGEVWHTMYSVTYRSDRDLHDSIRYVMRDVELSLSVFEPASVVSRVNRETATEVDPHFTRVYNVAKHIHEASGHMFDPTISPLITAWGFGDGHTPTPDTLRLDSIKAFTGMWRTRLDMNNMLVKDDRRVQFNFSGIAKGYGCDAVASMLARNMVTDFLIEIGGEIVSSGNNPQGGKWRVGIDVPSGNGDDALKTVIAGHGMAVATSGNYRNFHSDGTRRFGHTISPVTGRPAETDVASATVLASECVRADALATAVMAMGAERGMRMLDSLRNPGLLILTDGSVVTNNFIRPYLSQN